jgi:hypothetical protein
MFVSDFAARNSEVEERKAVISRTIKYVQNHIKGRYNVK